MEIHALQPRVSEATAAHAALTRQLADATTAVAAKSDVPADVKASLEALTKEVAALAPKLARPPAGAAVAAAAAATTRACRRSSVRRRTGLTAGMSPADPTVRAYTEVKAQTPKAIADINASIAKAATLSTALAKYNVTLTVPAPVKVPDASGSARRAAR